MAQNYYCLFTRFIKTALSIILGICLILIPFGASTEAARTSMTGDYLKDTTIVVKSLKEIINAPSTDEENLKADEETVFLITDYISRYRNRYQINSKVSYTTMQTALNSLAGHYKTFPNRPVPEKLKARLDTELSKAEALALKNS